MAQESSERALVGKLVVEQLIHAYRAETQLDTHRANQQHRYLGKGTGLLLYTLGIAGQAINKQSEVRYAISVVRLPTAYLRGLWEACFKCHPKRQGWQPHAPYGKNA